MRKLLSGLIQQSDQYRNIYRPEIFKLDRTDDKQRMVQLIKDIPHLWVMDEILSQVEELIKSQNPKTVYKKQELTEAAEAFLKDKNSDEYGVWVYYPWSARLIHILDEEAFIQVRTNRNQYKITPKEREVLSTKKVGIIGLSVGQSVALTMAMERSFGELRIGDFDILELSNYNRIRTGLYNLGVSKVVAVAREIAEIDPYLKVTCYQEGVTEENIDDFLIKNGKLDVLIDECDGLNIKVLCRLKAKKLGIPVLMDTSDKGMLDVERFDLEPDRPILHGFIDHLDYSILKNLKTNEEKVPFVLPMMGVETLSKRMKASMLEIEQTVTTWPQLCSAVTMGGGLTADVYRRIVLDQFHESGRYFVDLEEIVRDKQGREQEYSDFETYNIPPLAEREMGDIVSKLPLSSLSENQVTPAEDVIKKIVYSGSLAPSAGNNQPWKWLHRNGNLYLFHDRAQSASFGDYQNIASYITMGAAIENVVLEAHQNSLEVAVKSFPLKSDLRLVATFTFYKEGTNPNITELHEADRWAAMIPRRFTNRNYGQRTSISSQHLEALKEAAHTVQGAVLNITDSEADLKELADIIGAADRLRFMHPQCHYDFYVKEIRWDKTQNELMKDGLDLDTFDLTPSERAGLKVASDAAVVNHLRQWNVGTGFEKMSRKAVNTASAIGLITMPEFDKDNFVKGGRAAQRVWLAASELNISLQPLFSPPLFFARLIYGNGEGMPDNMKIELEHLRKRYLKIFPVKEKMSEVFLFRLCIADTPSVKSLRRPLEEILIFQK